VPKKRRITSPLVYEPEEGTWSNCFLVGDQIVLAGMVSLDRDRQVVGENDAYAQSVQSFTNMKNLVEAAGGTMADITKLTAFLTDMEHRPAFLEARREFFTGDFPAALVIGNITIARPSLLVEFEAWGVLGCGQD
jgi:2-iminobutanoate/2-iminopropanoate deaminase